MLSSISGEIKTDENDVCLLALALYGEADFIQQLWNKVKSGFRRYSKQGKLR